MFSHSLTRAEPSLAALVTLVILDCGAAPGLITWDTTFLESGDTAPPPVLSTTTPAESVSLWEVLSLASSASSPSCLVESFTGAVLREEASTGVPRCWMIMRRWLGSTGAGAGRGARRR